MISTDQRFRSYPNKPVNPPGTIANSLSITSGISHFLVKLIASSSDDDLISSIVCQRLSLYSWIRIIKDSLKPWFEFHDDVILDGELYNHDLRDNFEKIISLVRKTKPTDEDRQEASEMTQFHCYDIISQL